MSKIVYIAGPFRGSDGFAVTCNIHEAELASARVMNSGAYPLCPHSVGRNFVGTMTDQWWLDYTTALMLRCDAVLVLPGASYGSDAEIKTATERGMPVFLPKHGAPDYGAMLDWLNGVGSDAAHGCTVKQLDDAIAAEDADSNASARLAPLFAVLRSVLARHPHLRIGQAIHCAMTNDSVLFYVTDDQIADSLRANHRACCGTGKEATAAAAKPVISDLTYAARCFGDCLRKTRTAARKSMGDTARYLNCAVDYLSDVERGDRSPLVPSEVKDVCAYFGTSPSDLIELSAKYYELPRSAATAK